MAKKLTELQARGLPSKDNYQKKTLVLQRWKENILGYGFIFPAFLVLGAFVFYPFFQSVYLSFFTTDPSGNIAEFAGFQNYIHLFTNSEFLSSLGITLLFTLYTVPASIILALLLAVLTYNKWKGMQIFQLIFSLPIAMTIGTSSLIWMLLYDPSTGLFNYLLHHLGLPSIQWLNDPSWALISVSIMSIWMSLGLNYIILLAGVRHVPEEIYESARVDGAGSLRILLQMTIPLMSPYLFFVFVTSVISSLQAFGQFNILTNGGPADSTNVFVFSLYQEAFVNFQYGLGSTRALILFVVIMLLTWLNFKFGERRVHYQ
ncbi:carbohydrate ABC transporter permease [Salibacterium aidingense]|uniref:carbohydrate ABC transporter permease n=1 Tax=Salibacterium aidingense TaxID=384933 RepID=UPI003BC25578